MVRRSLSPDLHTLTGAYALNALTPSESVRFEDHLADCDSCVQEVRGFAETSARLAATAAETPPAELRAKVLEEVARTRQLAPAPERLPEPRRRGLPWTLGLVLAACLAAIIALGAVVLDQRGQVNELRTNEQQIAAVLAAPDAVTTSAEPMEDVSVTVVHSESLGDLVFSAHGLEDLHDEDYQLWLTRPDGRSTQPVCSPSPRRVSSSRSWPHHRTGRPTASPSPSNPRAGPTSPPPTR